MTDITAQLIRAWQALADDTFISSFLPDVTGPERRGTPPPPPAAGLRRCSGGHDAPASAFGRDRRGADGLRRYGWYLCGAARWSRTVTVAEARRLVGIIADDCAYVHAPRERVEL